MSAVTLSRVIEDVKALTPEEQREVREVLDEALSHSREADKTAGFHGALLYAGLVKEVRAPGSRRIAARRLVEIRGKPLSETIIEERR